MVPFLRAGHNYTHNCIHTCMHACIQHIHTYIAIVLKKKHVTVQKMHATISPPLRCKLFSWRTCMRVAVVILYVCYCASSHIATCFMPVSKEFSEPLCRPLQNNDMDSLRTFHSGDKAITYASHDDRWLGSFESIKKHTDDYWHNYKLHSIWIHKLEAMTLNLEHLCLTPLA